MSSRNATYVSQPGGKTVERQVINSTFSYNPLVDPPGYSNNTQSMTQGQTVMSQQPQYIPQQRQQYQPADRNYFEQNLIQINDQMQNVNSYNQQAVNHNQMLLEMQENKLNTLMNDVKKLKDVGGNPQGGMLGGRGLDRDKDLENLMMLNAFDDSLANTRLYYGDKLFNSYGRNAKINLNNQLFNQNAQGQNSLQPQGHGHRRNFSQPILANPQQNYRNEVFGGFGELFWDNKQNPQHTRQQSSHNQYDNYNMNQPISAPSGGGYNPPPPYQPQQSVFQRNSSQILGKPPQQYQGYNQPQMQNSYYLPQTPQILKQQAKQKTAYDIPNSNFSPQKSTAYSMNVEQNPPIDDPLTNLLVKQGNLMQVISTNIEKETKKQEKQDLKNLKKKLDKYEGQQKQMQLEDEYQNMYGKKSYTNPNEQRIQFDPMNPYKYFDPNNPYKHGMYDPFGAFSMPLQLIMAMNKNNGESKSSKIEMIKMQMLMRKLAVENELLRNGGKKKSSEKQKSKKSRRKSKKPKRSSIAADDDDEEEDFDDEDEYYDDDDDEDEYYDSDEYYDDEDEEQEGPPQPPPETEEEKRKREEEEQKKAKEIRIKELIKRLRLVKTRAMFPIMYFNTIRYQIQEKKTMTYKKMNEDLSSLFDNVTQWVQKVCSRGLVLIQDTKASCDITKKLSDKEMRKRVDNLKLRVKAFLDGLADNCKEEDIGNIAISIFGNLTNSFNFPPQQFLYKFEINRLKYTYYGALKVLILRILFKPWNFSEKIKDTPEIRLNMKVIQSVIYEILIEYLRNSCPPIQNNQSMLSAEKKIKEIPKIPAATNDPVDPLVYKDAQKNDEPVLLGLFQRNQLESIFDGVENSTWIETMKSTIQGLGESLVQTVNKKYDEMKAKQRQENQSNKQGISALLQKNIADKDFLKKLKEKQEQDGQDS